MIWHLPFRRKEPDPEPLRVLILVLSAMREPWGEMLETQKETWDSVEHPQTSTVYYVGMNPFTFIDQNIFYSKFHDEELERVSARTLEAFNWSLIHDWDFVARAHSSTYVHKKNLVDFIRTLSMTNTLCGLMTTGDNPFMWGGGGFIMSRDVIEKFVTHPEAWNLGIMEDNSITEAARKLDIPLNGSGRMASINMMPNGTNLCMTYGLGESFNFVDYADIHKAGPHYFWRCKQDLRRHEDLRIMRELKKHLP